VTGVSNRKSAKPTVIQPVVGASTGVTHGTQMPACRPSPTSAQRPCWNFRLIAGSPA
jgi:hypothetical protein